MRKHFLVTMATFMLLALPTQAQLGLKWGLKAGVNVSNLSIDGDELASSLENYTGFQAGPTAEFILPLVGLGFDAALLYSQKGFKSAGETNKLSYLEVPLNLKYKMSLLGILGAYATAGPYFSYRLSSAPSIESLKDYDWKDSQTGLNVGLGVEVLSKLQLGVNYQKGLSKDSKKDDDSYLKNSTWTLSAAYFF